MGTQLSLFRTFVRVKTLLPSPAIIPNRDSNECTLQELWVRVRAQYFPVTPELDEFRVCWSPRRQKRVLASCFLSKKLIRVAREMGEPRGAEYLEPLLYHEMCHAYLGVSGELGKKRWSFHGKEFRELEKRHPGCTELNQWIKTGGWSKAVRSARSREAWKRRKVA